MVQRLCPAYVHRLGELTGSSPTLTKYYQRHIPVTGGQNDTIHDKLDSMTCQEKKCNLLSIPTSIGVLWPDSFFIMGDSRRDLVTPGCPSGTKPFRAKFEREFQVGEGKTQVGYRLVARVVYLPGTSSTEGALPGEDTVESGHYVLQAILENGDVYDYDDCAAEGKLTPAKDPSAVEEQGNPCVVYYAYARTTKSSFVSQMLNLFQQLLTNKMC